MDDYAGVIDVTTTSTIDYQAYSVENPTTSIQAAERMWTIGEPSRSGERVTPERTLAIGAVWQAITLISGDLAKLPIHLYQRDDSDGRQKLRNHPLSTLVRKRPNPDMTAFKLWSRVYAMLLLYGNAYIWIERDRLGVPVALWPMLSWQTRFHREDGMSMFISYVNDEYRAFYPEDVVHLERMCIDCTAGEELVDHARDAFGLALARQGYMSDFYRFGGRLGGKLRIPANFKSEARQQLVEGFRRLYNTQGSAFLTYVAKDGVDYEESKFSMKDSDTIEGLRASNRTVAQYYNIHPSKIGEEHKSAYASKSEDNRDYLDTTLSPYIEQTEQELELKLFDRQTLIDDRMYFEYNTDKLLRMNPLDRATMHSTLRQANIISPNEARQQENMPPYEGGDTYANPNTTSGGPEPSASTQAHHIVTPSLIESHRDLLRNQIEVTLRASCQRLARHASDPAKFAVKRAEHVAAAVQTVVQAAERVFRAYAASTGCDAVQMKLQLETVLAGHLDTATSISQGNDFRDRLNESTAEISADELTDLLIPAKGETCDSPTT